jgi:chemotaxis protein methyltransferase CheR
MQTATATRDAGASPGPGRLSQRDFARLARFIQDYSGIKMPAGKITMLEGRLRARVRATGTANLADYCRYLFDQDGIVAETVHLIDAVTTNKTEFFREPEHFRILAETILPATLEQGTARRTPVKVWSAASSTGAEPYTLAMVLDDFALRYPGFRSSIVATDICTEVLQIAVRGIYPQSMMAPVPPAMRQRYVRNCRDRSKGLARIVPELRARVQYGRLNLMDSSYPLDRDMDVIFCRNILIYFERPIQDAVMRRLCDHLRPGGHLVLGHSESLTGFDLPLRSLGATVFQRT